MRVYSPSDEPAEKQIGECKCEVCGATGELMLRSGKQFRRWYCKCPNGHRLQVKKEIDDIFQIGDRVRMYDSTFGKDSEIIYGTYTEGIVVNKERDIINYSLSVKIDIVVSDGKPIPKTSWMYGHIVRGVQSDSRTVELLTPQMRMLI